MPSDHAFLSTAERAQKNLSSRRNHLLQRWSFVWSTQSTSLSLAIRSVINRVKRKLDPRQRRLEGKIIEIYWTPRLLRVRYLLVEQHRVQIMMNGFRLRRVWHHLRLRLNFDFFCVWRCNRLTFSTFNRSPPRTRHEGRNFFLSLTSAPTKWLCVRKALECHLQSQAPRLSYFLSRTPRITVWSSNDASKTIEPN